MSSLFKFKIYESTKVVLTEVKFHNMVTCISYVPYFNGAHRRANIFCEFLFASPDFQGIKKSSFHWKLCAFTYSDFGSRDD